MELSIVIPAHNEEDNLPTLIDEINKVMFSLNMKYEILLVDDNSTDNTEKILGDLRKKYDNLRSIHRKKNQGVGNSLKEGFREARGEIIITMDADFSHDPKDIPRLYKKLKEGFDIVIGSRYIAGGTMESTMGRLMLSRGFAIFTNFLGLRVHDATTGYRAQRKEVLDRLNLESTGFEIHVEIPMKAKKKGFTICEIPIKYSKRKEGKSKLRYIEEGPRYIKIAIKSALGF
jgi:dolichol-phosphate mannosyltransferase